MRRRRSILTSPVPIDERQQSQRSSFWELGLLPLVVFVLTGVGLVRVVVGIVCWSTLLVMPADAVRTGDH